MHARAAGGEDARDATRGGVALGSRQPPIRPRVQYRAPSAAQGVGGQLRLVASVAEAGVGPGEVWMPVPYPLPPVPYRGDDAPWAVDVPQREPDALGYTFRT